MTLPRMESRGEKKEQLFELECRIRNDEDQGSRKSRKLRRQGLIPGVIFGNNASDSPGGRLAPHNNRILITTDAQKVERELKVNWVPGGNAIESRVYTMKFLDSYTPPPSIGPSIPAGSTISVIPRHLTMHPVMNQVTCLNFLRYWPGRVLKVPLKYSNEEESKALKRGAFIVAQNRFVDITVGAGKPIPPFVEVDCTGLRLKDAVRRDRLILPDGCEWGDKVQPDFLVGSVFGRAKSVADDVPGTA